MPTSSSNSAAELPCPWCFIVPGVIMLCTISSDAGAGVFGSVVYLGSTAPHYFGCFAGGGLFPHSATDSSSIQDCFYSQIPVALLSNHSKPFVVFYALIKFLYISLIITSHPLWRMIHIFLLISPL